MTAERRGVKQHFEEQNSSSVCVMHNFFKLSD